MKVADAMTTRDDLVTVSLPGTRDDVLEYLKERSFSSVPVVKDTENGEVYRGLVSREDLIEHPDEDQLALLMADVPTTHADTTVEELCHLMATTRARRIPVVDGNLEGIITITDVIRAIAKGEVDADVPVGDVAQYTVNATYAKTPLPVVGRELQLANEPYAVVLDDENRMAGIVTEVDIIHVAQVVEGEDDTGDSIANQDDAWMWEGIKAVGGRYLPTRNVEFPVTAVEEFMTSDVVTLTKSTPVKEAAQLMITHDVEQLPLMSGDELIGVIRDVNVLEAVDA